MRSSLGLAALLLLLGSAAAEDSPTCSAKGPNGQCLPASALRGEDDGALAMLQRHVKGAMDQKDRAGAPEAAAASGKRQLPNQTALWDQLSGAVNIEHLEQQLASASEGANVSSLQAQLDLLKKEFPSAQEMHARFADQWDEVTAAVDLQNVTASLHDLSAQALDSETVANLQAQADALSQKLSGFSVGDIKDKAADFWANLTEQGVSLPDLDELEAATQSVINQAHDMLQGALSGAADAVSGALGDTFGTLGNVSDAFGNLFR